MAPSKVPTWEQLQCRVSYPLVRPKWVVRPPAFSRTSGDDDDEEEEEESGSDGESRHIKKRGQSKSLAFNKDIMLKVFRRLPISDLLLVMRVCRKWSRWSVEPCLWQSLQLEHRKEFSQDLLRGAIRRQPHSLSLSWSHVTKDQLSWLIARLPQLKKLYLQGLEWSVVSSLSSPYCPALSLLDLSYCIGITDTTMQVLLQPPRMHRPGHREALTRLRQLHTLKLAGTHIQDSSVQEISHTLPCLKSLDLSNCGYISEKSISILADESSLIAHSLKELDIRGCHQLPPLILPVLTDLTQLAVLAIHPCSQIPIGAIHAWAKSHGYEVLGSQQYILTRSPPIGNPEESFPEPDVEVSNDIKDSLEERAKDSVASKAKESLRASRRLLRQDKKPLQQKEPKCKEKDPISQQDAVVKTEKKAAKSGERRSKRKRKEEENLNTSKVSVKLEPIEEAEPLISETKKKVKSPKRKSSEDIRTRSQKLKKKDKSVEGTPIKDKKKPKEEEKNLKRRSTKSGVTEAKRKSILGSSSKKYLSKLRKKCTDGGETSESVSPEASPRDQTRRRLVRGGDSPSSSSSRAESSPRHCRNKKKLFPDFVPTVKKNSAPNSKSAEENKKVEGKCVTKSEERKLDPKRSKDEEVGSGKVPKNDGDTEGKDKRERSGSRDRPERTHRSPRRLSVSQ